MIPGKIDAHRATQQRGAVQPDRLPAAPSVAKLHKRAHVDDAFSVLDPMNVAQVAALGEEVHQIFCSDIAVQAAHKHSARPGRLFAVRLRYTVAAPRVVFPVHVDNHVIFFGVHVVGHVTVKKKTTTRCAFFS